ncbi:MAG: hypothetical protein HYU36_14935 [Planctomycetes bacterium]|nr:hypothetical protein [Planctomycetota bacterium]
MPEPVRLGPAELKQQYGLSVRLAARVGSLLKRRIGLSAMVLERAGPGSPMERMLLSAALARPARKLSSERLQQESQAAGGEERLAVEDWQDWQVIVLEEELEAEEGWRVAGTELVQRPVGPGSFLAHVPGLEDTSDLFTPGEIRRLKLEAVAGADLARRRSAIRQLALSPAPAREKILVYVGLLTDSESAVRAEAVSGLEALGLRSDVASTLRELAEGDGPQRILAARRLSALISGGSGLEGYVIVRSLLGGMERESELPAREAMLAALGAAAPLLAQHAPECQAAVRLIVQQLRERPAELGGEADRALAALADRSSVAALRQLWELVQSESEPAARVHLLGFLCQKTLPEDLARPVIERSAEQLAALTSNDEQALRLGHLLAGRGDLAAEALLSAYPRAHPLQRTFMVQLLDRLASRGEPKADARIKQAVGDLFLSLLQGGERAVRLAVLEGNLCSDRELDQELRRQLIHEMMANLKEYHHPRTRGLVESTVARIGIPALGPLMEIIETGVRPHEREMALQFLGKVFQRVDKPGPEIARESAAVMALCWKLAQGECVDLEKTALVALADVGACPFVPGEVLLEISRSLRDALKHARRPFEVLRALGTLSANPATPLEERLNTATLFLQLFRSDMPQVSTRMSESGSEPVLELGHEILAYTEMMPTLLQGFESICISPEIPMGVRERVVEALRLKWRAVMEFREVWGPANITRLLGVLRTIAASLETQSKDRLKIFQALTAEVQDPGVLAAVGEICAHAPSDASIRSALPDFLDRVLAYWTEGGRMGREESLRVLRSLGQMMAVKPEGRDVSRMGRLRERVIALLYDALREKVPGVGDVLRGLSQNPELPERQRNEIVERLAGLSSLGRRDAGTRGRGP